VHALRDALVTLGASALYQTNALGVDACKIGTQCIGPKFVGMANSVLPLTFAEVEVQL